MEIIDTLIVKNNKRFSEITQLNLFLLLDLLSINCITTNQLTAQLF